MLDKKHLATLLILSIILGVFYNLTDISADFQKVDDNLENWAQSTTSVSISKDNYLKLNLAVSDQTLQYTFISYLTFHTILNLPLEVTSYLNHNKKEQTADFALQVQTSQGNFSLGLNGTIIVDTPETGPIFIEVDEGEQESIANFSEFLGENIMVPLNFIPFIFPINIGIKGLNRILVVFSPSVELNTTSSLEAKVMNQDLVFQNSKDVYVDTFPVSQDFSAFSTEMRELYFNLENTTLLLKTISVGIILETSLGDLSKTFSIDLSSLNTSAIIDPIGELILLYISSTFYLGNLTLSVVANSASFSLFSLLAIVVFTLGYMYWKKRKMQ